MFVFKALPYDEGTKSVLYYNQKWQMENEVQRKLRQNESLVNDKTVRGNLMSWQMEELQLFVILSSLLLPSIWISAFTSS